jgi:hypothetical protein
MKIVMAVLDPVISSSALNEMAGSSPAMEYWSG